MISFLSSDLDNPEIPRSTRERRISYKRTKRLRKVCLIFCDECSVRGISYVKMFSGRGKLTCATCRKKGIPCVSFLYGSVERAIDKIETNLKDTQDRQQQLLRQLLDVQLEVQRHEREVELARKRGEEQFWCLERSLEEAGEPNLYTQVREAMDWERELYSLDNALPTVLAETGVSSSQGF